MRHSISASPAGLRACGALAVAVAMGVATTSSALAGETVDQLPNGAELSVTVDSPVTGDTFLAPAGETTVDVPLSGTASVAAGEPNVSWVYVIDVSGSTGAPCSGGMPTVLDCEKQAVIGLNDLVVSDGSAVESGAALFAEAAVTVDVSSAAGDQPFVAPDAADFDAAVGSVYIAGATQFTNKSLTGGATNYTAGLQAAAALVGAASGDQVNVVFMSDGVSNEGAGGFAAALGTVSAGATIFPFAVGASSSCTGGSGGTLAEMAAASGTDCTEVPDPADLPDIITNVTATELTELEVTLDGTPVSATVNPSLPQDGPVSVTWTAPGEDLAPGGHEVCATASGIGPASDPSATHEVTRCETFSVFAFTLTPPTATNELGSDDTHTVTAAVLGPAGELAGWPVDLSVSAGPNAGESGTCDPAACTTDSAGEVTFAYTVPVEPDSLGTDTISATVEINGDSVGLDVSKLWQDTTAPVAQCVEGVNPDGDIPGAPGNGGQGQNQDGFYELVATDDVWPDDALEVYVTDDGSGHVFGPFSVGDTVKWTEANGAKPTQKPGDGEVEWKLKGTGDAVLTATDGSGNTSDPVTCLVPNPPQ